MIFDIVFSVIIMLMLIIGLFCSQQAIADQLKNSILQRIGNYNIEMKTDPKIPIAGQTTKILLRISSVNGDEIVDLPIVIRIVREGVNLEQTHPIFVPYGHFVHEYIFSKAGVYALYIDINDTDYSAQNIVFTFPINVSDPFSVYFSSWLLLSIASLVVSVIVVGTVLLNRKRKKNDRRTIEHRKT
jgi:hypothetical protein